MRDRGKKVILQADAALHLIQLAVGIQPVAAFQQAGHANGSQSRHLQMLIRKLGTSKANKDNRARQFWTIVQGQPQQVGLLKPVSNRLDLMRRTLDNDLSMSKDLGCNAPSPGSIRLGSLRRLTEADYLAVSQNGASIGGEPIVKWWADMMEIPCVAFDPVELEDLDILLPQNPDFIRPDDAMWESAEAARDIVSGLMQQLKAR